jgi:transcriptional regulator
MEAHLAPKPIWKMDKVSPEALAKMMRQIVPVAMDIDDVDGTWKLAQNKPDAARLDASKALEQTGFGLGYQKVADLMRNPPN